MIVFTKGRVDNFNAVKPSRSSHNVVQVYLFGVDYFVDIQGNTHFQALKPVSK